MAFERSGRSLVRARRSVAARSGEAWPGRPSVAMTSGALTYSVRTPRAARPAEKILAAKRRLTYEEGPFETVLMVEALVELQDAVGLRAFLPEAERIREALAVLGPAMDRATGLMRLWEGDAVGARPPLERALAEYERLGNPFEAARTREHLADALPGYERRTTLETALGQYERLGATPSVVRLRSAGVASGV